MMYTALYYPHINIEDQGLIKTALLLWDRLEYIVPGRGLRTSATDSDSMEALEIISFPHIPSHSEKEIAHRRIMELLTSDIPEWFFFKPERMYGIYMEKYLPKTWEILHDLHLAEPESEAGRFITNESLGLSMMSILAESCAGSQKRTVTDEIDMYSSLTRSITALQNGNYGETSPEYERLVTISLRIIDAEAIDIRRLIELRTREAKNGDTVLRTFRHNYLDAIDRCVSRITQEARHEGDQKEIERQFEQDVEVDLNELLHELRFEARQTILSKEILVAGLAAVGVIYVPIAGSILSSGAVLRAIDRHRYRRQEIMKNHAMSWLYLARNRHPIY